MESVPSLDRPAGPRLRWWPAALLLAAGALMHVLPWNLAAFIWLNRQAPEWPAVASSFSLLGLGSTAIIVFAAAGLRRIDALASFLLTLCIGGLAVHALKWIVDAPRPLLLLGAHGVNVIGIPLHAQSMPSGHAATWAAAMLWAWCLLRHSAAPSSRTGLALLLVLLATLGALARAVVGAHWPADLLVGAGLGAGAVRLIQTPAGRRAQGALARLLGGPRGPCLIAPTLALTTASLVAGLPDYPDALATNVAVCTLGVAATVGWARRMRLLKPAVGGRADAAVRE